MEYFSAGFYATLGYMLGEIVAGLIIVGSVALICLGVILFQDRKRKKK